MYTGLTVSEQTLNCRGHLLDLSSPVVMGVINVTPDSFYDESRITTTNTVLNQIECFIEEGAGIIDIGAASSRPGAMTISSDEELRRLTPIIDLVKYYPEAIFSIDTTSAETASYAMDHGWHMINDISGGGDDKEIWHVAKKYNAGYVMMHIQGRPETMQNNPSYSDVSRDILSYFIDRVDLATKMEFYNYCLDPGFGFGKSIEQNYELLKSLHIFTIIDKPLLIGLSRKSMIYSPLGINPKEALNGTTALHMVALQQGAQILRVHDVKEAVQAVKLFKLTM